MFGIKRLVSLLVLVVLCQLVVALPRGSGGKGGGRSSGRSRGGRTSRGGRSGSRSRSYIKATSFSSGVYISQASRGLRSRSSKTTINSRVRYSLSAAPVFRYGYSYHGGYLEIPDERALRIYKKTEELADTNGKSCLPNSQSNYTLIKNAESFFVESRTKVGYSDGSSPRNETLASGVELDGSAVNHNVSVNCTAKYNRIIVPETNCSTILTRIEGTMVKIEQKESDSPAWIAIGFGIFFGAIILIIGICLLSFFIHKKCSRQWRRRLARAGKHPW